MTSLDLITKEMDSLQGVNKMTEKFILGKDVFRNYGIELSNLITNQGQISIDEYKSHLGTELNTKQYQNKRNFISKAKENKLYNTYFIQKALCEKDWRYEKRYLSKIDINHLSDVLFFQTPGTAYFYFKKIGTTKKKTILISHADTDPLEQLFISRKELVGTRYEKELRGRYKFVFDRVDKVVTICSSSKEYMKSVYGIDAAMIINGIEDAPVSTIDNKYSSVDGKVHFVSVGSIITRKGFDIIVDAASKIKDKIKGKVVFHFIGTGKDIDNIKKRIADYNLNDLFVIHGALLDVSSELNKMDAFLFPTRSDTVPVSIIEALRAGIPVFSTHVGEIPNMINDGAGELIEATVESVEDCIKQNCNGSYDLKKMGENARKKYENCFTLEKMCTSYASIIQTI